jgi:CspA family cold shock protein
MYKGTVISYDGTEGFIKPAHGGSDIFVHVSDCFDKIKVGDTVIYDTSEGMGGMNEGHAANVRVG